MVAAYRIPASLSLPEVWPFVPRLALSRNDGTPLSPAQTTLALVHDDVALSVRFELLSEPPLRLDAEQRGRPAHEDECVELFIAGPDDPTLYLEVVASGSGALYTARVRNPEGSRASWLLTPDIAVPGLSITITGQGGRDTGPSPPEQWASWSCSMTLPWTSAPFFRGPPENGELRRANFYRIARGRTTRFEALSPTLRSDPPDFHVPHRFATLRFGETLPKFPPS